MKLVYSYLMRKFAYLLCIAFILFSNFSFSTNLLAEEIKLGQTQEVIVNKDIGGETTKEIGNSGFFATQISDLKESELSDQVEINLIQRYVQTLTVNDPLEPQAYLTLLDANSFWDVAPDASDKVIAVIDSGFALDHEDLLGRWATNSQEMGATEVEGSSPNCTSRLLPLDKSCNNIDDDSNGYIDDWRGWDFAQVDNEPKAGTTNPTSSKAKHATWVSGLVGATGNNATGVASLNWQSKILPLQIFTDEGSSTTIELAEAISYAIQQGVNIINLSLGTSTTDPTIESLLSDARDAGIIVVAAAGNCGGSSFALNGCDYEGQTMYPATSDFAIAVGGTDLSDVYASFSSRGSTIDIVAPATGAIKSTNYLSTNEVSTYSSNLSGTSFATPIVSSVVATLLSAWPTASFNDIRSVLIDTAFKPSGMSGSFFSQSYGFGRIDPLAALNRANSCKDILISSDFNCDGSVNLLDLSLLSSQWQIQNTGRTDSNNSGLVDLLDLSLLASKWGQ